MAALKREGGSGNWARESAKDARGGGKREKRGKGSRFQHPIAPEFLLSLPLLTPATRLAPSFQLPQATPYIPTSASQMNKLHAVKF